MKEFIEKLFAEQVHNYTESMNQKAWIIHQILIYSFTNPQQTDKSKSSAVSLFGQLLTERSAIGQGFLNII